MFKNELSGRPPSIARWSWIVLLVFGCIEDETQVNLSFSVRSNQGSPIDGAVVVVDQRAIGETNAEGRFRSQVSFPGGARKRVEVRKESDKYYYAPFFESFLVAEEGPQQVDFNATLYFVPKPTPEEEGLVANQKVDAPTAIPTVQATQEITGSESEVETTADSKVPDPSTDVGDIEGRSNPPIVLSQVDTQAETEGVRHSYPKPERVDEGEIPYTVHVYAGERPIHKAQVFLGRAEKGDLKLACSTNERGRCVVRFKKAPKRVVTFVVRRPGYKTKSIKTRVKEGGKLRILVEQGQTVDVFAITKSYNFTRGLSDVEVWVRGKPAGTTDRYGYFSYVYSGKKDDLLTISLKPRGFLPEVYETDFVASGPMTLVRYFTAKTPPPVKMTLLLARPAGELKQRDHKVFDGFIDRIINRAARKYLFSSAAFKEHPLALFNRSMRKIGVGLGKIMRRGWQGSDLKADVDALLLPTLISDAKTDRTVLQLSVIDSKGKVLAAAKEGLDNVSDERSIERAVNVIAKKIVRVYPFEGSVLGKDADRVTINIGYGSGRGIRKGDRLDAFGNQSGKLGRNQVHKKIADLTVIRVGDQESVCRVERLSPRASIARGDLVALRMRSSPSVSASQVRVRDANGKAAAQANIYFRDRWIGATDEKGRLYADLSGRGSLKVVKHGYRPHMSEAEFGKSKNFTVKLSRETAYVRVHSTPLGATVKIDGKKLGKTPFEAPVPVPAGFVKLEVVGPSGYKVFRRILELDDGTLDLTGTQAIKLEKDILSVARRLVSADKVDSAIDRLKDVPPEHSDYLLAQHELGEIYLTMLGQPAEAAKAFGSVTKEPAVKQFSDKRFIGSHINEGVALYLTAESLMEDSPKVAVAHYQKAIDVLEHVAPHLRFVPRDQYAQAVHNVDFHRALARHKIWRHTKDPSILASTARAWRSYLDGSARTVASEEASTQAFIDNAKVYYKQAQASLLAQKEQ